MVEFHVLQCADCNTFQVLQVTKTNKWKCKLCGSKQSVRKVYGRGTGADCRRHVQKLNTVRGHVDEELSDLRLQRASQAPLVTAEYDEIQNSSGLTKSKSGGMDTQISRWSQFVESPANNQQDEDDQEFDQTSGQVTTDWTDLQSHRKKQRNLKRKRGEQEGHKVKHQAAGHFGQMSRSPANQRQFASSSRTTAKITRNGFAPDHLSSFQDDDDATHHTVTDVDCDVEQGRDWGHNKLGYFSSTAQDMTERSGASFASGHDFCTSENTASLDCLASHKILHPSLSVPQREATSKESFNSNLRNPCKDFPQRNDTNVIYTGKTLKQSVKSGSHDAPPPTSLKHFSLSNSSIQTLSNPLKHVSDNVKDATSGSKPRRKESSKSKGLNLTTSKWGAYLDDDSSNSDHDSDTGDITENGQLYVSMSLPSLSLPSDKDRVKSPLSVACDNQNEEQIDSKGLSQHQEDKKMPSWLKKTGSISGLATGSGDVGSFQLGFSLDDDL